MGMKRSELQKIGEILNCGGKGGKPGPCPLSGKASGLKSADDHLQSAIVKFPKGTKVRDILSGKTHKVLAHSPHGSIIVRGQGKTREFHPSKLVAISRVT